MYPNKISKINLTEVVVEVVIVVVDGVLVSEFAVVIKLVVPGASMVVIVEILADNVLVWLLKGAFDVELMDLLVDDG